LTLLEVYILWQFKYYFKENYVRSESWENSYMMDPRSVSQQLEDEENFEL